MEKIIFFDWDGTLCSKKVSEIGNLKRTQLISEDISKEEIIKIQHNNNNEHYKIIQDLIKLDTGIENKDIIKRMQVYLFTLFYLKEFNKNFEEHLLFDKEEFLNFKKENKLKFVIVTSLFSGIVEGILSKIDPNRELFDSYYAITDNISGNKIEFIEKASKEIDGVPLVMVGDRGEDIEAGKKNNINTIFCNYGHGNVEHATYSIEDPKELIPTIKKFL